LETKAVAKYIRISPRKARLVVDTIRGKDLDEAQQILDFSDRAAARVVSKVLRSAAANAENNNGLSADTLFVSRVFVDEGPTLKRFRPRAMGRATRINKRTCHITVILDEREPEKVSPKKRRIRKAATAARDAVTRSRAEKPEEEEPEILDEETQDAGSAKPAAGKTSTKAEAEPERDEDSGEATEEEPEEPEGLEEDTDIEQAEETEGADEEAEDDAEPSKDKSEE
jgi:large subunit ribosomal protein L22